MTLRQLLQGLATQPVPPVSISGVSCNSKQLKSGELFIAVKGPHHDGHLFIEEAAQRGASAIVAERLPAHPVRCPVILLPDTKQALPRVAARWYGEPATRLHMAGVTGTCGKTTTTYLIKAMLEAAGHGVGLLGTVAYQIGERSVPSTNTTPGAIDLQNHLAQMVEHWLDWCVMEVSSHALDQGRIDGLQFDAAVFTNLGSDHLDYHRTREAYAVAKRRIFQYLKPDGRAILNVDDVYGRTLVQELRGRSLVTVGMETSADVRPQHILCSWQGTSMVLESPWGVWPLSSPLAGRHNIPNILEAAATCLALGVPGSAVQQATANFLQVPGRMERITNEAGLTVVIDYAHTADALRLVLLSMRELVRGRLIAVFGCGGDRDQSKRPMMGQAASLLADAVVLTSDNPRSEEPLDIIQQIKAGFVPTFHEYQVVLDRECAIHTALAMAKPDDAVLIAGKGHEAYQIFSNTAIPFSDRDAVERALVQTGKTIPVS